MVVIFLNLAESEVLKSGFLAGKTVAHEILRNLKLKYLIYIILLSLFLLKTYCICKWRDIK